MNIKVSVVWLPTAAQHDYRLFSALWCAPGSPYKSLDGALTGVRYARENKVPLLGTCGGFQHVILEYARNVMGIQEAAHAEYDPYASQLFIQPLSCSLKGQTLPIQIRSGTLAALAYGSTSIEERYYCNFGLNPACQQALQDAGLLISGWDEQQEARIVEIADHPFYLATLFVPQSRSPEGEPHPLIVAFVQSALGKIS